MKAKYVKFFESICLLAHRLNFYLLLILSVSGSKVYC